MATRRAIPAVAYRPDIDGLRAVAIAAVLLFHAFPQWFPGGFVGVDIFFVISGFLITGNINRGIESRSFSIRGFYLRRVRRIFPALVLVLACCLVAGYLFLTAGEFMQLGKNTAAAAAFVSNFSYWAESGYFDNAAISKPLLHLWSLGIEEQFYLLWPLLIVISQRKNKGRELTLAIILISFVACVLTTAPLSYGAFYSPVTRMWELALGGILALTGEERKKTLDGTVATEWIRRPAWLAQLGSFAGVVLIAAAVWALDATTPYPGWKALFPTVGAGLIIAAGRSAFLNRVLLSHPLMVFIGLISYPLYLWHWPLLSFAHIIRLGIVPFPLTVGLLVASVLLATGTYLLLERPLHRTLLSWRLGGALVAIMACLGIGGGAVYKNKGAKWSAHAALAKADTRSPHALDHVDKVSASQPLPPAAPNPAPVLAHQPVDSEPKALAHASAKVVPATSDTVVVEPSPSRVTLYREHVAEAMRVRPGDPDAYLFEMGMSRLKATRFGVCEYSDPSVEAPEFLKNESCGKPVSDAKNVIVIGDSIGADTYAWLHAAYPEYNVLQKTGAGCNLLRAISDNPKPCAATMKSALDLALSPTEKIDAVVLVSLWDQHIVSPGQFASTNTVPLIDKLLARGRKVVLVGPPVGFTVPPRDLIDKCPNASQAGLTNQELETCAREHSDVYRKCDAALKQYAQEKGLPYVDLYQLACNDSECPILDKEGQLMYVDAMHRSFPGDEFVAQRVRQNHVFDQILGPP